MDRIIFKIVFILLTSSLAIGCSSAGGRYIKKDYGADNSSMIKNIAITAQAPGEYRDLDKLLLKIASDTLELKLNYLVHKKKTAVKQGELVCGKQPGIILFSIEKINFSSDSISMGIKCELFNCSTGELIWHIYSEKSFKKNNRDLENLTAAFRNDFGANAEIFSAVIFAIIRDIAEEIPNPSLTEDEKLKKIELEIQ